MTQTNDKRDPSGFTSLNDLLKEEGIFDEVTQSAKERVAYQRLLNLFMEARAKVEPYNWSVPKLIDLRIAISEYIRNHQIVRSLTASDTVTAKTFVYQILHRGFERTSGFNITVLDEIHRDVTIWLDTLTKGD